MQENSLSLHGQVLDLQKPKHTIRCRTLKPTQALTIPLSETQTPALPYGHAYTHTHIHSHTHSFTHLTNIEYLLCTSDYAKYMAPIFLEFTFRHTTHVHAQAHTHIHTDPYIETHRHADTCTHAHRHICTHTSTQTGHI